MIGQPSASPSDSSLDWISEGAPTLFARTPAAVPMAVVQQQCDGDVHCSDAPANSAKRIVCELCSGRTAVRCVWKETRG